ncbi:phage tail tube protein, partial [Escherichia coli]|uniref:phage tail tube protein n=1 Tax=Escherichia coli TaxID=562 RepID=UPI00356B7045
MAEGQAALAAQGTGTTGSRMANGSYAPHLALEKEIAEFFNRLTPGELTAESYDDSYLDDEDADWTATGQGQKSAGDTSFTLAW